MGFQAQEKRILDANFHISSLANFSVFQYGGPENFKNTEKWIFCIRFWFSSSIKSIWNANFHILTLQIFFGFPIWRTQKFQINPKNMVRSIYENLRLKFAFLVPENPILMKKLIFDCYWNFRVHYIGKLKIICKVKVWNFESQIDFIEFGNPNLMQKFDFPVFLKFSGSPYWKTEKLGKVDTWIFAANVGRHFAPHRGISWTLIFASKTRFSRAWKPYFYNGNWFSGIFRVFGSAIL